MKKLFVVPVVLLMFGFAVQIHQVKAVKSCDSTVKSGNFAPLGSISIGFSCTEDTTVYFGVCDSGGVPNDDLFRIIYNGVDVASNRYENGQEITTIGEAVAMAGSNTATLQSLNDTPYPPATYTYALSPDKSFVEEALANPNLCGLDVNASFNPCLKSVPLFTTDKAPSSGTLRMMVQYGAWNRSEGQMMREWAVQAGDQINNEAGLVLAPKWVRVWWQPEGSSDSYLLPSQYWQGDGTLDSEYGVSCNSLHPPSYHTSFSNAIHQDVVPELQLN